MSLAMKLSKTSLMHYYKLFFRSALFLWALITYLINEPLRHMSFKNMAHPYTLLLIFVWIVFMAEMISRLSPSNIESMGCNKQFKNRFKADKNTALTLTDKTELRKKIYMTKSVRIVLGSWLLLNGMIFVLYWAKIITDGILLLIALFYSVSDMICILFFCPFQTWMMKNRCCTTCRIYNWDFLMMFTPLIIIPSFFTWTLAGMGLILFLRWEYTVFTYPERFLEESNASLKCKNCTEKLCHHKKQLHRLWKHEREQLRKLNNYKNEQLQILSELHAEELKKLEDMARMPKEKLSSIEVKQLEKLVRMKEQQMEKIKKMEEKIKNMKQN